MRSSTKYFEPFTFTFSLVHWQPIDLLLKLQTKNNKNKINFKKNSSKIQNILKISAGNKSNELLNPFNISIQKLKKKTKISSQLNIKIYFINQYKEI